MLRLLQCAATLGLSLLTAGQAWPQGALLQGGPWQPGHVPQYVGQGSSQAVVQDGGGAGGGAVGVNPAELGLTARGTGTPPYAGQGSGPFGTIACSYDAPTNNATGYHFLCLSPNAQGGGLLAYGAGGTAAALPFAFNINGISYAFPFVSSGVVGPSTSVVGDLAVWNNTSGTLLKDVPASTVVTAVEPFLDLRSFAVSPLTFATVCTGGDDTATLQAAVNAANANIGQLIMLPASACHISSAITGINKANIHISGQGGMAFLNAAVSALVYTASTGSLFVMDGVNGIEIDHTALLYSNPLYSGDLIDLRQVSGTGNSLNIRIHDCFIGPNNGGGLASSLIRLGSNGTAGHATLSTKIEHCIMYGAVQVIKGEANANNTYIANNYFNPFGSTSHIGSCGEGWTIFQNTFEPTTNALATNNIVANCATGPLVIVGNTFNDGGSGTLVDVSGAVVSGLIVHGNDMQGGTASLNAGAALGVSVVGNNMVAGSICNVVVNLASNVTVKSNANLGTLVCALPTLGNNEIDEMSAGRKGISFTAGLGLAIKTVATLPTCGGGQNTGMLYAVSDATTPTYGTALTGGGAVGVLAYCDATSWKAH